MREETAYKIRKEKTPAKAGRELLTEKQAGIALHTEVWRYDSRAGRN